MASQEEAVGKTDADIFPRELADQYYADEQEIMRTGLPMSSQEEPVVEQAIEFSSGEITALTPEEKAPREDVNPIYSRTNVVRTNPRILQGAVDMGCFEYRTRGSILSVY